jgi:hypothetical protein
VRAIWWLGVPSIVVGWFLLSDRTIGERPDALYAVANAVWSWSPVAAMLVSEYTFTLLAIVIAIVVSVWSHRRRTGAVRLESLYLPTFVAGLEACVHLVWFGRCRGLSAPPSPMELHDELHVAVIASAIAMTVPLLIAFVLTKTQNAGVAGPWRKVMSVAAMATVASVLLLWAAFDGLLLHPPIGRGQTVAATDNRSSGQPSTATAAR